MGSPSPNRRRSRPPRRVDTCPVEPVQQCRQLCRRQPHHPVADRWPFESTLIQRLPQHHQTSAVPSDDLDPISTPGTEDEHRSQKRILAERFLGQRRQTIRSLPEVHRLGRHQDPDTRADADQRTLVRSAVMIAVTIILSAPGLTRTSPPPNAISITPMAGTPDVPAASSSSTAANSTS